ncbi:potassium voltage-gated channel protein Shaw-like [Pecten maximus]|uniref:potassium voltage-gated channel protein Shaw-like n=1 Tax=Pecten maximus TaxID=6579 RepID=UPI001458239A|nr:potassium voltage-gated channel protein Shaw-like [Pecten maximus]
MAVSGKKDNLSNMYRVNVGGRQFEISRHVMESVDGSRLQRLVYESEDTPINMDFFFERPGGPFEAILAYHQTGRLHIPGDMCPAAFKQELEFWDISPDDLETCCYHRYLTFSREQAVMAGFMVQTDEISNEESCDKTSPYWTRIRSRMRSVLDNKDDSLVTQAYFVLSVAVILLSVLATALGTLPGTPYTDTSLDDVMTTTTKSMMPPTDTPPMPDLPAKRVSIDAGNISISEWEQLKEKHSSDKEWHVWNDTFNIFTNSSRKGSVRQMFAGAFDDIIPETAKSKLLTLSTANNTEQLVYIYMEYASNAFFTVELFLRLLSFPCTLRNAFCFQHIIEMIVLSAVYIRGLLSFILTEDYHSDIDVLLYLQMLRVLRLLRLLENVTAYRVLCYTLRVGKRDMFIMFLYVLIGVLFFSNVMYVVEKRDDFPSIPDTWWWSVITMTTVGYGDMIPKTAFGKIIGTICALSGVFMFSLIIPIFVNTFLSLYQFADVRRNNNAGENKHLVGQKLDSDEEVLRNADCVKRQCV